MLGTVAVKSLAAESLAAGSRQKKKKQQRLS
jgi:hypothetical protein